LNPLVQTQEALALLELGSIARGIVALDALTKRAIVRVLRAEAVSPGKFLILFAGPEADVGESFEAGKLAADKLLLDSLHLPDAHPSLVPMLDGVEAAPEPDEALTIQEYASVASGLLALDRALKAANVAPRKLRVARGIGGKAYFVLGGTLADVTAADEAARAAVAESLRVQSEIIARLSSDVRLEHL
jgi:microcompartment protein CcmL/EutN